MKIQVQNVTKDRNENNISRISVPESDINSYHINEEICVDKLDDSANLFRRTEHTETALKYTPKRGQVENLSDQHSRKNHEHEPSEYEFWLIGSSIVRDLKPKLIY